MLDGLGGKRVGRMSKLPVWERIYYGWWYIYNDAFWEWKYLVSPQTTSKWSVDFWYSLNFGPLGAYEQN